MILFLKETLFEAISFNDDGCLPIFSINSQLNKLATKYLFSISSYKSSVKKILFLKNKIPLYFSDSLFFFYLREKDSSRYYINYFSILKICYSDMIVIIFKNGFILRLNVAKKVVASELKKIETILNYVNNLC